jgi:uncharacterized FlaG/YvyC family protein
MRLDNIPGAAVPYAGPRPDAAALPRRAEPAAKVTPTPELLGNAESPQDSGRSAEAWNVDDAVSALNEKLLRVNRRIVLYEVDGTHEMAAKVVDTETNEVIDFIPPESLVKLRARLREMRGVLVDKGA